MLANVAIWIGVVIISYIVAIFQIYGIYQYRSLSKLLIIKRRYWKMVIIEAIAVLFHAMITLPLLYNYLLQASSFERTQCLYLLGRILTWPLRHFITNVEASRLWLISFDLQYIHSSKNETWKTQIDPTFAKKDWYLLNKNKWGNIQYIIPGVAIYYLFATFISTTLFLHFDLNEIYYAALIDGLLFMVPCGIILYTYHKCPKNTKLIDNFFFYHELKITAFIYATAIIAYIVMAVLYYTGFILISIVSVYALSAYAFWIPSLMSTYWIPHKVKSSEDWELDTNMSHILNSMEGNSTSLDRLQQILGDDGLFGLFVLWMYREFSSETILCFIEMVQFKQYLIENVNETQNEDERIECKYKLSNNLPKSFIVYEHINSVVIEKENDPQDLTKRIDMEPYIIEQNRYKRITRKLYKKYIDTEDEFAVNIAHPVKKQYIALDANNWDLNVRQFVNVFDDIIDEMFYLMAQSYTRFEHKNSAKLS